VGRASAVAVDAEFDDKDVMNEAVDGGDGHGLVGEDGVPQAVKGWLQVMTSERRSSASEMSSKRTLVSAWSFWT